MKRVIVELEDDLHKRVKIHAIQKESTVKGYVKELIVKDLEKKKEQPSRPQS